jgi:DNA modification methylase
MEANTIHQVLAQEGCPAAPDTFADLILTSPPFELIFTYGDHWRVRTGRDLAPELFRIAKPGSVLAWMVRDQVIDGDQSGESFLQVFALKEAGFRWADTITFESGYLCGPPGHYFRTNTPIYIFTKGYRPAHRNNLIRDVEVVSAYDGRGMGYRQANAAISRTRPLNTQNYRYRGTTRYYSAGGNKTCTEKYLGDFPAKMHEGLAQDLIRTYSDRGDVVFDPFGGVMTTSKMALLNHRKYLAFEPDPVTFALGDRRMRETHAYVRRRAIERLRAARLKVSVSDSS